jgi:uncharacterized protein YcbX
MRITVTSLTIYPVKSCAGIRVDRFRCLREGPEWDREWMITGKENRTFVTQREVPKLALIQPELDDKELRLTAANTAPVAIPLALPGTPLSVQIWGESVPALDQGDEAARWISEFLGLPDLRLVRVTKENRARTGADPRTIRFADSYPLHVCSEETLADLNARLPSPIPLDRFRPNVVVKGGTAWGEDYWRTFRANGFTFRAGKRAERCVITTIDQKTAQKGGPEPLKTLAGFRRNARGKLEFGAYFHSCEGAVLETGMTLHPRVNTWKRVFGYLADAVWIFLLTSLLFALTKSAILSGLVNALAFLSRDALTPRGSPGKYLANLQLEAAAPGFAGRLAASSLRNLPFGLPLAVFTFSSEEAVASLVMLLVAFAELVRLHGNAGRRFGDALAGDRVVDLKPQESGARYALFAVLTFLLVGFLQQVLLRLLS